MDATTPQATQQSKVKTRSKISSIKFLNMCRNVHLKTYCLSRWLHAVSMNFGNWTQQTSSDHKGKVCNCSQKMKLSCTHSGLELCPTAGYGFPMLRQQAKITTLMWCNANSKSLS